MLFKTKKKFESITEEGKSQGTNLRVKVLLKLNADLTTTKKKSVRFMLIVIFVINIEV